MIAVTLFIMFNLLMWWKTALEKNAAASGSLSDVLMEIIRVTCSFGVLFWTVARGDFCARGTESGKSDITTSPWIAVSILSSLSACTIYHIKKCYIQYQGMNLLKHLMRKTKAMCPIVIHGSRVWGDEIITTASGCPSVWMSSVWIQYSLFVAVLVAHTASFLWDSLWLQPLACTSIVGPHSYPRYAFLIGPKRIFLLYIFSLQYYE